MSLIVTPRRPGREISALRRAARRPDALPAIVPQSPGPAADPGSGPGRCAPYLAGVVAGTADVLAAVAAGITAALLAVPALRAVLTVIAIAYILWLAYHIATAPPATAEANAGSPPSLTGGILLGVANPPPWLP